MIPAVLFALQVASVAVAGQGAADHAKPAVPVPSASARVTRAVRAVKAPVIDGRDDDPVWRTAEAITQFRQYDPVEDGEPPLPTEAKVAYDDHYIYAFVRAYDPHPDSIRSLLSRRDQMTPSDQIMILIDSYHDKRTGYEFQVNPAGVKYDAAISGDGNEDSSWDGVWDVATRIDGKGWTAEFRIPLSQLRFAPGASHTFGFAIARTVARSNVKVSWPLYRRSRPGIVSQFGDVTGINGVTSPRRLEVTPYTVGKDLSTTRADNSFARSDQMTAGADIKYGLTSNLTVDATINPDFGQVEADPSVLNLTAFEQFYEERRPFFLEGAGIFRYDLNCSDNVCSGLFYSRRIGRAPQLSGLYGNATTKQNTNIIGAAKLTGRLANGLSVGVMDAATERVTGPLGQTVEPQTNYFVGRLTQDFRNGNSGVGLMVTATNRQLDTWSRDFLRQSSYVAGVDGRHRFGHNNYQLSAYFAASTVAGTPAAIDSTQRSSVHNYQRPDGGPGLDSTRTSLGGYTAQIGLAKNGGDITRFWTGIKRTSSGFEINDAGFLTRADIQSYGNWLAFVFQKPSSWYRSAQVNFNEWTNWNTGGMLTDLGGNINAHAQFRNQWWGHFGYNVNNIGTVYDDRAARGGPAVRALYSRYVWLGIQTDRRWRVSPNLWLNWQLKDAAGSSMLGIDQNWTVQVNSRLQARVGASWRHTVNDQQWNGNVDTLGVTHYTFAHLEQTLTSMTARLDFTATPTLSLQVYASPFLTSGNYTNWRELADPRAANYADRYRPFTLEGDPSGFNFKQFRSNTVIRWEYRPGSVLYLVWTQGRTQDGTDPGTFVLSRDARNLFRVQPDNTFLIKTSYWFSL